MGGQSHLPYNGNKGKTGNTPQRMNSNEPPPANRKQDAVADEAESGHMPIVVYLEQETGIDLSIYKPTTMRRRITRRQELSRIADAADYLKLIERDSSERDALLSDLLIGVTGFFRDPEAFEVVHREAISQILSDKHDGDEVRVWVAGCATGEEAYSFAIMLDGAIARTGKRIEFQVCASDAFQAAVDLAAAGAYDKNSMRDLNPESVDQYFVETRGRYQIVERLRQRIMFVQHNLMHDTPFTRVDLVCCRNLLSYLQPHAQKKCLSVLHLSLQPGGFLLLGSSETIGYLRNELDPINKRWRLFRKRRDPPTATNGGELKSPNPSMPGDGGNGSPKSTARPLSDSRLQQAYDALLLNLLPAGFLVDADMRLLHSFGQGGDFLKLQSGRHSDKLPDLIHPDLRAAVIAGVQHCLRIRQTVKYANLSCRNERTGDVKAIDMTVASLGDESKVSPSVVISFDDTDRTTQPLTATIQVDASSAGEGKFSMEQELNFARNNLHAKIEELESSNNQLQSDNAAMTSGSAELRRVNQKLQSVNQELQTVNDEDRRKIAQLQDLNDDVDNLLRSSEVAVLFLNADFSIRRFTPHLAAILGLRPQDVGRDVEDFQSKWMPDELIEKARKALRSRHVAVHEISIPDGRVFETRITAFDSSAISDGVVIHYLDVTLSRQKEDTAIRWASIVESTADCIIALDLDGSITQWNRAATSVYGWTSFDAIGKNFFELVVPREYQSTMAMQIEQVRVDQVASQFDSVRTTKHGKLVDVSVRLSPVVGSRGNSGVSSIERDVTFSRKNAKLRELERQVQFAEFGNESEMDSYQVLARMAIDAIDAHGVWVWKVDGLTQKLNATFSSFGDGEAAWLKASKIDLETLAHRTWGSKKRINKKVADPTPYEVDSSLFTRADVANFRLILKPMMDHHECVGVLGVLVAIDNESRLNPLQSALKMIAASLASHIIEENRLGEILRISKIVENASDLIGSCDAHGNLVFLNRAGRLLCGIGLDDDVRLLNIRSLYPPDQLDEFVTSWLPEAKRVGHWSGETELIDQSNNRIPVSQLITSHRDHSGELRYFSTIGRVIAEQKGVQSRLEELIRKMQSTNDTKTTFLANISHDVRTPMTAVIGMAELLLEQSLDQEQRRMVNAIVESGKYVTTLLNDLLDLSKVEAGQLTITPTDTDLKTLLREIVGALQATADQRGVLLTVDLQNAPEQILQLDAIRVRQITENLLSNAIKYTNEGQIVVTADTDDGFVVIAVEDSGCGIDQSELSNVFDPYVQAAASQMRSRGAGLGLAISRKLAQQMNGSLSVQSTSGVGSCFTLRIPIVPATGQENDFSESHQHYPLDQRPLEGKRIILAEDTRAIQFLVQRILETEGVNVTIVGDGRQLLRTIETAAKPFHLILMDMQMPVMDGYEATRSLRSKHIPTPIVALSASTMPGERRASLEAGCNTFVGKPIDRNQLLAEIYYQLHLSNDS